jgi:hypothetical protein
LPIVITVAASDPILLAVAPGESRWRLALVSRLPKPILAAPDL